MREHTIEFFHIHREGSSYGSPRNLGIRVLNDDFTAPVPNGPRSGDQAYRSGRYHFRFNAYSGSTFDRCVDDLERFVRDEAEPWFKQFRSERKLVRSRMSPLSTESRKQLRSAIMGNADPDNVAASLKMMGIKLPTRPDND